MTRESALAWLLCLGLALGCSNGAANEARGTSTALPACGRVSAPPTIVLITLDTIRREHLGCYGYFRETSPHLDALAREALVFERALASMASTLPSHLTLMTGLYPHQHGMTSNNRGARVPFTSELGRLAAADVLQRCGYRTAGFVSGVPLAPTTGIHAGFGTYSSPTPTPLGSSIRAGDRNVELLAWLAGEARQPGPIFLWVHYFDPHEPYDAAPPYDTMFTSDKTQFDWIRARHVDLDKLTERYGKPSTAQRRFLGRDLRARGPKAKEKEDERAEVTLWHVADLMNRYDGELRYMDDQIGEVLAALRRHGRYEESIIVVAGDHGQSLGENGWFGHGTITNVNTFVPLIVRLPDSIAPEPRRIDALVSLADVLPTVMARFELPGSEILIGQFEGEDVLSGNFTREHALVERSVDGVKSTKTGREVALLTRQWKFLHRSDGKVELYDLGGAGEFVDVMAQHPDVAARLQAKLDALLARKPALLEHEQAGPEDLELLKSLEELGYVGEEQ
jgi:arylsulfatase